MSSYDYGHNTPDDAPSGKKQTESEILSWLLIFFCFVVFWPLGLFLLIRKLSGDKKKAAQQSAAARGAGVPPGWSAPAQQGMAGTARAAQPMRSTPSAKKGTRWALKLGGGVLAFVGLLSTSAVLSAMIGAQIFWQALPGLLAVLSLFGAGVLMLGKGIAMDKAARRYARYLAAMASVQSISFVQLSGITGFSQKRVEEDLDHMIGQGYFGPTAYLDLSLGYFFPLQIKRSAPWRGDGGTEIGTYSHCADAALSAKIDRLEEVTAQIFRAIEKDGKKASQVRTFLEYYLPTTQKLLDSYAEFEAAGIEGENLHMAKEKIEDTMDNIVRGFERQLDALYAAEAMDIQSDIDVMNSMMQRDSAMHTSDFQVSSSSPAAVQEEKQS